MDKQYAIIIPYRNRSKHLELLLAHLSKYDKKYVDIYIFEQDNDLLFNRAYLFNSIFSIDKQYDYYIFHDVDLIPEDNVDYRQIYNFPTHLSCFCKQFNYNLLDNKCIEESEMFGGVIAMSKKHLHDISGYTELYEGWGYEDNDLIRKVKKFIGKYERKPWKYNSLDHSREHIINRNLYNNAITFDKPIKVHKVSQKTLKLVSLINNVYHYYVNVPQIFPCNTCHSSDTVSLINSYRTKQNVIVSEKVIDQEFQTFSSQSKKSFRYENIIVLHWSDIMRYVLNNFTPKQMYHIKRPFYSYDYNTFEFKQIFIYSPKPILRNDSTISLPIDIIAYYDINPDIKQAFSLYMPEEILNHYNNQGKYENRIYTYTDEQITLKSKILVNSNRLHFIPTLPPVNNIGPEKTLIISHPGGGGVEKYLSMVKRLFPNYILITPNSNKMEYVELHNETNITYYHENNAYNLFEDINRYQYKQVIINHMCIFSTQILYIIKKIVKRSDKTITILHDNMLIKCNQIVKEIMKLSTKVICPSKSLAKMYKYIKPMVIPHPDMIYPYTIKCPHVSNVIMCIGRIKGSKEIITFLNNTQITIIHAGITDITHDRLKSLGEYNDKEIIAIIKEHDPMLIWFPSRKAESYCYALSYAIMSGYPIVAYKIGAMIERLEKRPASYLLDCDKDFASCIDEIIKSFPSKESIIYGEIIDERQYCEYAFM